MGCTASGGSTPDPPNPARFGEVRALPGGVARGAACHDVGSARACWDREGPSLVATVAPEPAPPDGAWRCDGERCQLVRRRFFACDAGTCVQRDPRVPDDGDWECADVEGLVVCRSLAPPAGIVPGSPEVGWICGGYGQRICIDPSPDRPGAGSYACRFEHDPTLRRICVPHRTPTLGAPCRSACPEGMTCVSGLCVLTSIATPDCWTDVDCPAGARCLLARCLPR
jgi:hypothetical protein